MAIVPVSEWSTPTLTVSAAAPDGVGSALHKSAAAAIPPQNLCTDADRIIRHPLQDKWGQYAARNRVGKLGFIRCHGLK